jgi:hypothetical protein
MIRKLCVEPTQLIALGDAVCARAKISTKTPKAPQKPEVQKVTIHLQDVFKWR